MVSPKGFEVPNHTQTPNTFFDDVMPQVKSIAELKVIEVIIRQTFGWQKRSDRISMSQFQRMTGLSRQGVQNGIVRALKHEFIERQSAGHSFSYSFKLVNEVDQSSKLTSQVTRPKPVKEIDRKPVKQVDTQKKEEIKKEKEREFWSSLKANPAYSHIDLDNEINKMKAWLLLPKNKFRQMTPCFVLNWLNRIERPLDGSDVQSAKGLHSVQRQEELKQRWEDGRVKSA